jgi:hypothetical protein
VTVVTPHVNASYGEDGHVQLDLPTTPTFPIAPNNGSAAVGNSFEYWER